MEKSFKAILCGFGFAVLCCIPRSEAQQSFSDTVLQIPAAACAGSASGNGNTYAGTQGTGTGLMALSTGANAVPAYQVDTTSSGTNTHTYVCELACPTRVTSGRGCNSMSGIAFFYGVQVASPASQTLSVCFTVTLPNQGASETASTVGGAAAGGTITQIPAVASANLGTTTAGAFFTSYALFGTAINDSGGGGLTKSFCNLVFVGSATTAFKTNVLGANVFTTQTIGWMKRHGHKQSVDAMARLGIDQQTAREIYAAYAQRHFIVKGGRA